MPTQPAPFYKLLFAGENIEDFTLLYNLLPTQRYSLEEVQVDQLSNLPLTFDVWIVTSEVNLEDYDPLAQPPLLVLTADLQAELPANVLPLPKGGLTTPLLEYAILCAIKTHHLEANRVQSDTLYRSLLELLPEGVSMVKEGRVFYINPAGLRLFGVNTIEEMFQHSIFDFIPPEDHATFDERLAMIKRGEAPPIIQTKLHQADGQIIDVELHTIPITYFSERASLGMLRNITQQKIIDSQLRFQADLLQNVEDAIIAIDLNYLVTFWNKGAEWLYGWAEEEVLGKRPNDFIPAEYINQTAAEVLADFLEHGHWQGEYIQPHRDGHRIHIHAKTTQYRDAAGKVIGWVTINRDVTTLKKAEEHQLELVAERERVRALRQFIGDATHDLITPLTSLKTSLFLLEKNLADQPNYERYLTNLNAQSNRLEKLLEDMFAMSRLDAAEELRFAPYPINDVLLRALETRKEFIARMNHQVILELTPQLPLLSLDHTQMSRAVEEFIDNAVRFTPTGGQLRIETVLGDDTIRVTVQDTGIGISPSDLPHIFKRFYRADKTRHSSTGKAGLGLSIAQKIIELHEGWIEVESREGVGSTFRIYLPLP